MAKEREVKKTRVVKKVQIILLQKARRRMAKRAPLGRMPRMTRKLLAQTILMMT
jgi:hypothetical protein